MSECGKVAGYVRENLNTYLLALRLGAVRFYPGTTMQAVNLPSVCAIMLTRDRPEYARRAVESLRAQTYHNKQLTVVCSGTDFPCPMLGEGDHTLHVVPKFYPTIGDLRNFANKAASAISADIVVHFDDDDCSHPNRVAEQVALLQATGADVVGYNEMLFWREPWERKEELPYPYEGVEGGPGEAWLYTNRNPSYALGTSLCYWRKTWERKPFEATSVGEDHRFCTGLKVAGVSSVPQTETPWIPGSGLPPFEQPRMIARIHGGNTSDAYAPDKMQRAKEWKRVPEWDAYCAGVFAK